MPHIALDNLGKKFNREWIFRNVQAAIPPGSKLAILGGNGSGKSTLLQIISGYVSPSEGNITYTQDGARVDTEKIKNRVALASPYLQLIDDFTLEEMVAHAGKFKPFLHSLSVSEVIAKIELEPARLKYIRQFSSGMKQRLKLGLAILADTPLLLLDEPVSNLDRNAINWYQQLIEAYAGHRTVLVCSNAIDEEYFFCKESLNVSDYKPTRLRA